MNRLLHKLERNQKLHLKYAAAFTGVEGIFLYLSTSRTIPILPECVHGRMEAPALRCSAF